MKSIGIVIGLFCCTLTMNQLDKYAAKYGRGSFHYHSEIMFGVGIHRLNDIYFTSNQHWINEGYLFPGHEFVTLKGDIIQINELCGYRIRENDFSVYLLDGNGSNLELIFSSQESVNQKNPWVKIPYDNENFQSKYIDLKHPPFLVSIWGQIVLGCYLLIGILFILLCIRLYRKYLF